MSLRPPAVVLLSGGLDSATCLACAARDGFAPHCISFDYGQRHRHELAAAAAVADQLRAASHITVKIDLRAVGGSALTGDFPVPKDALAGPAHIPITYVPARNLTFLSLAVGYAEVVQARTVFIGVNAVDYSGYPDCRPEFLAAFERTANLATKAGVEDASPHFRIAAPLATLTKAGIIRLGSSLGVDYSLTHSCYDPVVRNGTALACGHCDSCLLRRRGFTEAAVTDPTPYA
ncbi:MAG: 7-cyano-7-deazaguanine synthase QueC [Phycisphaerales bacterium]